MNVHIFIHFLLEYGLSLDMRTFVYSLDVDLNVYNREKKTGYTRVYM